MKGKNGLTDRVINKIQQYFRKSLVENSTANLMQRSIWSTFLHLTSTDSNPKHSWCDSNWCWYLQWQENADMEEQEFIEKQKKEYEECRKNSSKNAQAFFSSTPSTGKKFKPTEEYPGHDSMKVRIPFSEGTIEYDRVKAVYVKMTDMDFLKRCEGKFTQNPNIY